MLHRLARDRSGTAAVEFAILVPLFVAAIMSTFEVGWLFAKSNMLDRALERTVRQMRIGTSTAPTSQAQMKTMICGQIYIVSDCNALLTVELTRITKVSDFPAADATCVQRGGGVTPAVSFTMGARAEIMFVRACLVTDALTPFVGIALHFVKDSLGGYSIVSTSAFLNEPGD
jgi:Flp pilus assembly protein TadG